MEMIQLQKKTKKGTTETTRYTALMFLSSRQYKILEIIDETENSYLQGEVKYPKTLEAAHTLVLNFKYNSRKYGNYRNTGEFHDGVAFVTGIK